METVAVIAWRNLWRNTRRSVLTLTAIAFAAALLQFMMCWQQGSYKDMIRTAVRVHSGCLQVQQRGYLENKDLEKALRRPADVERIVGRTPHVTAWTRRVNAPALVSFGSHTSGAMVFGVDPAKERLLTNVAKVMVQGEYLDGATPDGAIVGETLAKNLELQLGDRLAFLGQGADGSMAAGLLTVRGVFRTYMPELDRNAVFAPIATIGEAFALPGRAHEIAIMIDDLRRLDSVKAALNAALAQDPAAEAVVLGWDEVLPGVKQGIDMDWQTGQLMYVVLMMVVGFGIMNTFLMSFLERVREFGVLMAVGMAPTRISRLIALEAGLLTVVGLAAGLVVGAAVTLYFQHVGIYFASLADVMREMGMDPVMHPELSVRMTVRAALFVLIVSGLVALYPAFKVTRLRPVDAMRAT